MRTSGSSINAHSSWRIERLPFVLLALLSLLVGLMAGLQRIGWMLSLGAVSPSHGSIMVGGFLGTLIILEKIIPLKKPYLYLIPLTSALSVLFSLIQLPIYSSACLGLASAGLCIVFLLYWIRERSLIYACMLAGAVCWLTGNLFLIKTNFYPISIPWWMAFILFIITSERLELMKFLPVSRIQKLIFLASLICFLVGCLISFHGAGRYIAGAALVAVAIWLMRYDVVGINLKKEMLSRYVGVSLLSGYFALLLSGVFLPLLTGHAFGYDILVHSFFIGFVFSMIFAHGPIILPGVLHLSVKPYHPVLYLWLFMLHASWIVRTIADITLDLQIRKYAGLISAIAIAGYFLSIAGTIIRNHRAQAV